MSPLFDRDFDAEIELEREAESRLARACYTPEDLAAAMEKARREGYGQGHDEGRREAEAEAEDSDRRRKVAALEAVAPRVGAMLDAADRHFGVLERQVVSFALSVFEKIVPEVMHTRAVARAEAEVRTALAIAIGTSSLRIFLPPQVVESHGAELEQAAREAGHEGRVEVLGDSDLAEGDARVEWDNGFMDYSFGVVCNRIQTALRAVIDPPGDARSAADAGDERDEERVA